jgi:hypothetical protein
LEWNIIFGDHDRIDIQVQLFEGELEELIELMLQGFKIYYYNIYYYII